MATRHLSGHKIFLVSFFIFVHLFSNTCLAVKWGSWQDVKMIDTDSFYHVTAGALIGTLVRFSEPEEPKNVQFWHAFWLAMCAGLIKEAFDLSYYKTNSNKIVLTDSFRDMIMNVIGVLISFNMDFKAISGRSSLNTSLLDNPDPLGSAGTIRHDLHFTEKIALPSVSSSF